MAELSKFVDSEGRIRYDLIAEHGFRTGLVFDIFRGVEAEWLAEAIIASAHDMPSEIEAFSYDEGIIVDTKRLKPTRGTILEYVLDKNLQHTIVTDGDTSFVAYFAQYRDFFLLCGKPDFLQTAYPVSPNTIRFQYFENVELEAQRVPLDKIQFVHD